MKIQYTSDIHLENNDNLDFMQRFPLQVCGDVMVLSGDVFVMGKESANFRSFIDWCSANFKRTFIVPGNHEFYGGYDIAETLDGWQIDLLGNVSIVNNKSVVVDDVEFFFTTLWAHVPAEAEAMVDKYMLECQQGRYGQRPFRAALYGVAHRACRRWLDEALAASTARARVVVTHHCPVRVEDPRYESNGLSNAFVNPMEDYVAACGADAWIFGHTHYNGARGTVLGNTLLATNQLGYASKGVCDGFEPGCVIEV